MSNEKKYNNTARYASLATQWMVMLLIAVWGGYKLDKLTGWKFPLFLLVLPLGALGFSLWQLIKETTKTKE